MAATPPRDPKALDSHRTLRSSNKKPRWDGRIVKEENGCKFFRKFRIGDGKTFTVGQNVEVSGELEIEVGNLSELWEDPTGRMLGKIKRFYYQKEVCPCDMDSEQQNFLVLSDQEVDFELANILGRCMVYHFHKSLRRRITLLEHEYFCHKRYSNHNVDTLLPNDKIFDNIQWVGRGKRKISSVYMPSVKKQRTWPRSFYDIYNARGQKLSCTEVEALVLEQRFGELFANFGKPLHRMKLRGVKLYYQKHAKRTVYMNSYQSSSSDDASPAQPLSEEKAWVSRERKNILAQNNVRGVTPRRASHGMRAWDKKVTDKRDKFATLEESARAEDLHETLCKSKSFAIDTAQKNIDQFSTPTGTQQQQSALSAALMQGFKPLRLEDQLDRSSRLALESVLDLLSIHKLATVDQKLELQSLKQIVREHRGSPKDIQNTIMQRLRQKVFGEPNLSCCMLASHELFQVTMWWSSARSSSYFGRGMARNVEIVPLYVWYVDIGSKTLQWITK
ncbi:hypothetical protein AAMO2058_000542500 [Amorphochlora amoebiformis]